MTHEYVIALGGTVAGVSRPGSGGSLTAIAWAADRVLAVGTDDEIRSISRGDSTFLDLAGAAVTAIPVDPANAEASLASAVRAGASIPAQAETIQSTLERVGRSSADARLEPGAPADLAVWAIAQATPANAGAHPGDVGALAAPRIVALVRGGAFTNGDRHTGPFRRITITEGR